MPLTVYSATCSKIPAEAAEYVLDIRPGGPHADSPARAAFETLLGVPSELRYTPDVDPEREASVLREKAWNAYAEGYRAHLRAMYKRGKLAFDALLKWPRVYLVDDAEDPRRAFRTVLRGALVKLGACDGGEIGMVREVAPETVQSVPAGDELARATPAGTEALREIGLDVHEKGWRR